MPATPPTMREASEASRVRYKAFRQGGKPATVRQPDPDAFAPLRRSVVDGVGLSTRQGVRLELALLSGFVHRAARFEMARRKHGAVIVAGQPLGEGEFAASAYSVTQDLWARWFFLPPVGEDFERFYDRARKSLQRLVKGGHIIRVREVSEGTALRGTVWRLGFPAPGELHTLVAPPVRLPSAPHAVSSSIYSRSESMLEPGLVNAVDRIGDALADEDPMLFTDAEGRFTVDENGFQINYLSWARTVALGASGARFASAGAWKESDYERRDFAPSLFYYITFDFDRGSFTEDAFQAVRNALEQLHIEGIDIGRVIVSYTGGRGFHMRLPAGMCGNPIFRTRADAVRVLSRFAALLIDEEVDSCVFNPRQMLRMIGGLHPTSGLWCNAFSGDEFMSFDSVYEVYEACASHRLFHLSDPRQELPCPVLTSLIADADAGRYTPTLPSYRLTKAAAGGESGMGGSVMAAALEGCAEGDEWHPPVGDKIFIGRSKLLFVAACCLLRREGFDVRAASAYLDEVNARCTPPMKAGELQTRMQSAISTLTRAGEMHQGYRAR